LNSGHGTSKAMSTKLALDVPLVLAMVCSLDLLHHIRQW